MSFKEKINTIIFALKLSNDFDRVIYFIVLLKCLINSVLPLIPTYFSAMIVDELAGEGISEPSLLTAFLWRP